MPKETATQPVRPTRACIFCGGTPVTKEHLVGRWARRFADEEQRDIMQRTDREGEPQQPGDTREWQARVYDRQARVVCKPCNSGWMSDLETAVSLLLDVESVDGRLLNPDEQSLLATWAMKTALTLNAAQSPENRVMPAEVALSFGRDRHIPDGAQVWISSYTGDDDLIPAFAGLGIDLDDRQNPRRGWRDLSVITFVVGPFVFQVFAAIAALGTTTLEWTFPTGTHIAHLWPIQEPATWRHQPGLGAAEVVAFAEQIPASLRGSLVVSDAVAEGP
jgi:hypothetical protein